MGRFKSPKRPAAASTPYDRPQKKQKTNIFKMNKGYGQHILKNPGVADVRYLAFLPPREDYSANLDKAIIEKAWIQPTDTVLEVGPGTGNLTVRALKECRKLIAVEVDPRMAAEVVSWSLAAPVGNFASPYHVNNFQD